MTAGLLAIACLVQASGGSPQRTMHESLSPLRGSPGYSSLLQGSDILFSQRYQEQLISLLSDESITAKDRWSILATRYRAAIDLFVGANRELISDHRISETYSTTRPEYRLFGQAIDLLSGAAHFEYAEGNHGRGFDLLMTGHMIMRVMERASFEGLRYAQMARDSWFAVVDRLITMMPADQIERIRNAIAVDSHREIARSTIDRYFELATDALERRADLPPAFSSLVLEIAAAEREQRMEAVTRRAAELRGVLLTILTTEPTNAPLSRLDSLHETDSLLHSFLSAPVARWPMVEPELWLETDWPRFVRRLIETEARFRLLLAHSLVRIYLFDHGRLPASILELGITDAIRDPLSGTEMQYSPLGNGYDLFFLGATPTGKLRLDPRTR